MLRPILAALAFSTSLFALPAQAEIRSLIVAGGCFWCVESDFDHMAGVIATTSGYAGGTLRDPTYRNHGKHREVVKVDYDANVTDYRTLVAAFLRTIDPTDAGGQFCDRGHSYSTAIHANGEAEARIAREELAKAQEVLGRSVVTPVEALPAFWEAEEYHQNYATSQVRQLTRFGLVSRAKAYKGYRKACGRDQRVRQLWMEEAYSGVNKPGS
ncbi:peptide-methionine (S)-S-oxide reductase MsrA [Oricola sp.]|uniref:peptide-methionine (S)-S-oxide reductase MsrA n=1 Tax=Oricola sp. TaxID=1979950 RepID=UPI003BA84278